MALASKHPARYAAQGPQLRRAVRLVRPVLLLWASLSAMTVTAKAEGAPAPATDTQASASIAPAPVPKRGFRTFLPKPGEAIDDPASQVVQLLLDRQDKGEFDSYMVQVLFRGKPSQRSVRTLRDRVEIDFYDTGKPSMRLGKIRGGAVEASSVEEFFYKDIMAKASPGAAPPGSPSATRVKRLVRLTLFMHEKADLKFRDTLDRTLIHFRLPKAHPPAK